ncbi:rhomboid family intramembrane serine protease [Mycobacterium sp. MYCO198283]|uniref:rhomboid family intramembrane serine protease n=1 Tax=Mycobacterium sp. MYCO198283 TaxID=2883505 RepID=UPI001E2B6D54|nr:rhomboid family intramembrane serine protease [Mycobacterium sp. MYCO198283]MCG5433979.1 rhomboid family intramembrane serine protease [Mycobacterium sp. MYCO198283]
MTIPGTPESAAPAPTCFRHPDRATYLRCTRCGRYICPECMRSAAVGHQCVDCVHAGAASVREARTPFGGRLRSGAPVVTYTLIAANVVVFLLQRAGDGMTAELSLQPLYVADGEHYRLLSSAFLHYGLLHLLFNMWALYVLGGPLESWFGRLQFGALYGLSALGGSAAVFLLSPVDSWTAGASGAVFGLFGATFVVAKRMRMDVRSVTVLIVLNLVITFAMPSISWQGHIGGLVTGAAIAAAFAFAPRDRRNLIQGSTAAIALLIVAALVSWRTAELAPLTAYLG